MCVVADMSGHNLVNMEKLKKKKNNAILMFENNYLKFKRFIYTFTFPRRRMKRRSNAMSKCQHYRLNVESMSPRIYTITQP